MKRIITTLKKPKRGGFNNRESLTIFIIFLSSQNKNECCIFDKLEMFNDYNSVSKNNKSIDACVKKVFECEKDVILIPYIIPGHANLIIIRQNTVEWFEPHGPKTPNKQMNILSNNFLQQFVEKLNEYAITTLPYEYITPRKYQLLTPDFLCPNFGPQGNDKLCMTWSLYVLVQIVKNPSEDTKTIIDKVLDKPYEERMTIIEELEKNYDQFIEKQTQLNFDSMGEIIAKKKYQSNINFMQNMYNKKNYLNYEQPPITHAF
jgi:hypothetical protein